MNKADRQFPDVAIAEALKCAGEDGIPVAAAFTWRDVAIAKATISDSRSQRHRKKVETLPGETDCITNAGLFGRWRETTLYANLSPCMMCAGTIIQFKIPRVVIDAISCVGRRDGSVWLRERSSHL